MPQAAIVALFRHIIGLNPDAIGPEVIARAMRRRMAQCSASDLQTYLERIQTSEQELHALIEEVVVPETWFFRDQMLFTYLGRYVMAEWLSARRKYADCDCQRRAAGRGSVAAGGDERTGLYDRVGGAAWRRSGR